MKLIDMHCDTLWKLIDLDRAGDLMDNHCSVNIPLMKQAGTKAQFFACFIHFDDYKNIGGYEKAYEHALEIIAYLKRQLQKYSDEITFARSYTELSQNVGNNKISAVLTVEEGGILDGKMERLEELYKEGVRLITILWNYDNCIGHPNSRDATCMWQGLTHFGREVVERMGELGMIVDVSHASDGTFRDVMEYAKGPVVASHSNCRELCNHPRNLTDKMIRELANCGGVAGLNFYGPFLGSPKESRIEEMTAHILHMIQVGGSSFPAIGTDFDGFDGMDIMEIADASQVERLWDALKKAGLTERQLDKIWGENVERVLRRI